MKKVILSLLIAGTVFGSVFAEYEPESFKVEETVKDLPQSDCKIRYYADGGYWLDQGFDFEKYDCYSDPSMTQLVQNEIDKVTYYNNKEKNKDGYVVVGHSQGGPRSLAYATMLKELSTKYPDKYNYDQLKGVITVSGIDKGLKALEGGFGGVKSKLKSDINILAKGVTGALDAVVGLIWPGLTYSLLSDWEALTYYAGTNAETLSIIEDVAVNILGDNGVLPSYVKEAWNGSGADVIPQLYDMMPGSDFNKKYVSDTTTYTRKYLDHYDTVLEWTYKKVGILKIYYLVSVQKPVYKTYSYSYDTTKFDSNLPVGYIVGLDSSTINLVGTNFDEKVENDYDSTLASNINKGLTIATAAFATGAAVNAVESAAFYVTLNVVSGTIHAVDAVNCTKAAYFCSNAESYCNDIKNSTENHNDGLVADESQYIPRTAVDNNYYGKGVSRTWTIHPAKKTLGLSIAAANELGNSEKGYIGVKLNHLKTEPVMYAGATSTKPLKANPIDTTSNYVKEMVAEALAQ